MHEGPNILQFPQKRRGPDQIENNQAENTQESISEDAYRASMNELRERINTINVAAGYRDNGTENKDQIIRSAQFKIKQQWEDFTKKYTAILGIPSLLGMGAGAWLTTLSSNNEWIKIDNMPLIVGAPAPGLHPDSYQQMAHALVDTGIAGLIATIGVFTYGKLKELGAATPVSLETPEDIQKLTDQLK